MAENRWTKMDKGTWDTYTLLCDKCANKIANPMICKAYPDRKPSEVLKGSKNCPKFMSSNNEMYN